eukprot:CAMPEP_0206251390 /NCGR_PEP_ID=MMETSP0047_2-20121206/22000_1 /ASSEMBLY_ACC=CAM_ASM_000192 /TAXON_ID=195065 /ORGANISM="Chroomonas mesostigmatica_cf, Strain CCMP1168" /LENGTH=55 /DNA_ID=CAMNT_0053677343 /DNA_START=14 /DNA_END=181 /DNA_ORIENTATION=+
MFALLAQTQRTQLWDIDMFSACKDGSGGSEPGKYGLQECPPTIDNDTIDMSEAYY